MESNKLPLEKPQVNTFGFFKSKTNLLITILSVTSLLFALSTGFFVYKYLNIRKQPINNNVGATSNQPSSTKVTFSDVYSQIKRGGSISEIKTVNTDNWKNTSDKVTQTQSFNYSYQYPEDLYAVPNVRGEKGSLYFFENEGAYQNYLLCLKSAEKDWERGCNVGGDLLFYISVRAGSGIDAISNPPDELNSYIGWDNSTVWIFPKEGRFVGATGAEMTEYAEGRIIGQDDWVSVHLNYAYRPSDIEKIKNLTGLSDYQLFIHILASFEIS